jgi:hypothetical protein
MITVTSNRIKHKLRRSLNKVVRQAAGGLAGSPNAGLAHPRYG